MLLFAALAFSLLLSNSYAAAPSLSSVQCIVTGSSISIGTCIADAFPLSAIGIMLSFMIVALAFMAGEVMNYAPLKGFYRREMWEATKSMIILGIIFGSLVIASGVAAAFAGSAPQLAGSTQAIAGTSITNNLASLYSTVNASYLSVQLESAITSFSGLLGLSVGNEMLRSLTLETWFPIPLYIPPVEDLGAVQFGSNAQLFQSNYVTPLYSGSPQLISPSVSLVTGAADLVIGMIFIFQAQQNLIYVIGALGLGVFIPMGMIMRAIPFIRGIGGTMIAIGIGIAIVYPVVLIGFNLPVTNYMFTLSSAITAPSSCPNGLGFIFCTLWNSALSLIQNVAGFVGGTVPLTIAFGSNGAVASSATLFTNGLWTGFSGPFSNGIFPELNFVINNTFTQVVQALLFVLDIIIVYAATDGIASLMGGSMRLGIGKFSLA
ncbi:MAG: hypothetical protein ACREBH_02340 [Candidatus Micrarchaeaceae archaeon]